MTLLETILTCCGIIIATTLVISLILVLRTQDWMSRAVLSDMIFYGMLCLYFLWTLDNDTSVSYEIAMLGAVSAGVLPTLSMARIISQGRR
ncbi:cation:proton antiporter [Corynebacterium poyangense]|uniref:Cation:proton antiporter n=1 Tax=Corynebacterium poyangense TaxID=2684405 RepID=A0A7H0SLK8_9CORY|nr:cation:proton antiporter [Corynebacterium poyangense]MBZ8177532.1 cation:proton antiporter [Corynebacterium poyangense]QNQ89433.1 cation:proton antiporter [Corynebacterium poyangense]